jgi:CRP/FNR family cyclic AMP-dependent transcriptional regulator
MEARRVTTGRLATIPFFKEPGIELSAYETRCHWRRFDENEVLVDYDDVSTDVYFLASGEVRILNRSQSGKEVILGEICVVPAPVFRQIIFASEAIADRLFRLLAKRVRELNTRLMEHALLDLRHRLYAELLRLSVPRAGGDGERVVTPPPYHHVLAARIGCRREQVTREFTVMAADGLIDRTRGALVIRRPDLLEARVAEALREDN